MPGKVGIFFMGLGNWEGVLNRKPLPGCSPWLPLSLALCPALKYLWWLPEAVVVLSLSSPGMSLMYEQLIPAAQAIPKCRSFPTLLRA